MFLDASTTCLQVGLDEELHCFVLYEKKFRILVKRPGAIMYIQKPIYRQRSITGKDGVRHIIKYCINSMVNQDYKVDISAYTQYLDDKHIKWRATRLDIPF